MQPDAFAVISPAPPQQQPCTQSAAPLEVTAVFEPQPHSPYLCQCPIDMRLGFDGVLARVINWFGSAHPHCAYAFTNARDNHIIVVGTLEKDQVVMVDNIKSSARPTGKFVSAKQPTDA